MCVLIDIITLSLTIAKLKRKHLHCINLAYFLNLALLPILYISGLYAGWIAKSISSYAITSRLQPAVERS